MDPAMRVRELIEPALVSAGFELVDVEASARLLRVTVDRPGGIDLEAVSAASQVVSELLDRHDPVPGDRYTLEVSSPGLERRLRTPEHFRRFVDSTVAVRTAAGVEGERRILGRLASADDQGIVVAAAEGDRHLTYDQIDRAHTVFEWGPAPKPGRPRGKGARPDAPPSPSSKKKATTP